MIRWLPAMTRATKNVPKPIPQRLRSCHHPLYFVIDYYVTDWPNQSNEMKRIVNAPFGVVTRPPKVDGSNGDPNCELIYLLYHHCALPRV